MLEFESQIRVPSFWGLAMAANVDVTTQSSSWQGNLQLHSQHRAGSSKASELLINVLVVFIRIAELPVQRRVVQRDVKRSKLCLS